MESSPRLYATVILPLRISRVISYAVPGVYSHSVKRGSFVKVIFSGKEYTAVVLAISSKAPDFRGEIKELEPLKELKPVSEIELKLWIWMADYYMCTLGEVYKAAIPGKITDTAGKRRKEAEPWEGEENAIRLTAPQQKVYEEIGISLKERVPTLLRGVTGSGKTEIYIKLAQAALTNGGNVLFMVPEIAISRHLNERLSRFFGERLLVYHSGQTSAAKREVYKALKAGEKNFIVLGLRSSVFLPFNSLDLIIIDEEHDSSYKQEDPAPRYNGRDSALMLARLHSAGVVLGSATPSLDSIYNAFTGRYKLIDLKEKYYPSEEPVVEIIDTLKEEKRGTMNGLFSKKAIEAIKETLERREQVLIFRNRRSYSPMVQCTNCGDVPICLNCNVPLNYHKGKSVLSCHYCNYSRKYYATCPVCGTPGLKERGCGTEMIEEQVQALFPDAVISRFDSETTSKISEQKRILREFAAGNIDILIGTQMISKGFDFEKLTLVVLIQADSMFTGEDFRSGERAMQILTQLKGRGGRRSNRSYLIIQTSRPDNPVYRAFERDDDNIYKELEERKEFNYPPYIRMVKILLKGANKEKLEDFSHILSAELPQWGVEDFTGPFPPHIDKLRGEYLFIYWIKLSRSSKSTSIKKALYLGVESLISKSHKTLKVIFDVDPI